MPWPMNAPPPSPVDYFPRSRRLPPSLEVTVLDHAAFPHLLNAVLAAADHSTLLAFRATNRALRDAVDARLFEHVALIYLDEYTYEDGGQVVICTPERLRLPLPPPTLTSPDPYAPLRRVRVLDLLDASDEERLRSGAHNIVPLLSHLKPDIVRQLGAIWLPPHISLDAQVYVDWTWRTSVRPTLLRYIHPDDASLLTLSFPASFFASFSTAFPEPGPISPSPAPRIVLHCPATPLHTALAALLPLVTHLPRATRQLVLVFDEPWQFLRCWEAALEGVRRVPPVLAAVVDAVYFAARWRQNTEEDDDAKESSFDLTFVGVEVVHPDPELAELQAERLGDSSCWEAARAVFCPDTDTHNSGSRTGSCQGSDSRTASPVASRTHNAGTLVKETLLRQALPHSHCSTSSKQHQPNCDQDEWGKHVHFVPLSNWQTRRGRLAELETRT